MTPISPTSQLVALNAVNNTPAVFEMAQVAPKTLTALQPIQKAKTKATKAQVIRPPASARTLIIKTNGKLNSFKVMPKGSKLVITTPKGIPIGEMPNTTAAVNALKLGGAATLGSGKVATGTGIGATGSFLSIGTLVTAGLFVFTAGVTFFGFMGSANSEEPDVRKMEADRAARLKKQNRQQATKPSFKPLMPLPLPFAPSKKTPSFFPQLPPHPFKPAAKPAPSPESQPTPYKPVPIVTALPQVKPAPKGGSVKSPSVKGLKLAPYLPNYVGAREEVKPTKNSGKKAKGQTRASGTQSINEPKDESQAEASATARQTSNGEARAKKLKSTPLEERYGPKWMHYYALYYEWCEQHNIEPNENTDPLNPDNSKSVGFQKINGITKYKDALGQYYDASIFDKYLNGTVQKTPTTPAPAPAPAELIGNKASQSRLKNAKKGSSKPAENDTVQKNTLAPKKTKQGWHVFHRNQYYVHKIGQAKTLTQKKAVTDAWTNKIIRETKKLNTEATIYRANRITVQQKIVSEGNARQFDIQPKAGKALQGVERENERQYTPQKSRTLEEANQANERAHEEFDKAVQHCSNQKFQFKKLLAKIDKVDTIRAKELLRNIETLIENSDSYILDVASIKQSVQGNKKEKPNNLRSIASKQASDYKTKMETAGVNDVEKTAFTNERVDQIDQQTKAVIAETIIYMEQLIDIRPQLPKQENPKVAKTHYSVTEAQHALERLRQKLNLSIQPSQTLDGAINEREAAKKSAKEANIGRSIQKKYLDETIQELVKTNEKKANQFRKKIENSIEKIKQNYLQKQ